MVEVSLDSEKFNGFLRVLSLLREICNDIEIRSGIVRQRTNDKATIFEIDLTPLISDSTIVLSNLKQKLDLLKCFVGQEVTVISGDDDVAFRDNFSIIKFKNPRMDYLDNKFMPDQEFSNLFSLRDEDLLMSCNVDKNISDRMRIIAQGFNVVSFQVFFEGDVASISASTATKDQNAKIISGIPVNQTLNCYSNLVTTPFIIDHDGDMSLNMHNIQETVCINKFVTTIGDVNINVYGRSQLLEEEK